MFSLKVIWHTFTVFHYAFSWKRVGNFLIATLSYEASRLLRRPVVFGYPFILMVEPTNLCNLKCPLCPSGAGQLTRPRGTMDLHDFKYIIDELGEYLLLVMLWNQGEPFLNPQFLDMIRYARSKMIPTMTSTNGHFLNGQWDSQEIIASGLGELIVSLDGASPETYNRYRQGGDFNTVVENLMALCAQKKRMKSTTPIVHLQFLIMRHNEHEIELIRELARAIRVDKLSLKTVQVQSLEEAEEFLPRDKKYSRYQLSGGTLRTKANFINSCRRLWYGSVVNWDGSIIPCCFDKDGNYKLGNAFYPEGLKGAWRAGEYTQFRNQILHRRGAIPMCRNCIEGLRGLYYRIELIG